MPCTCDLGCAEEPPQAAPSLRHSMPGAGTRSVESPWLAMEFIAPLFARGKYEVTSEVNA